MEIVEKFKNYYEESDEGNECEGDEEIIYEEVIYEEDTKPKKRGIKAYIFGLIGAICGALTIAAQFATPSLCAFLDWGCIIFSVIGLFSDTNKKFARLGLILAGVRVLCGIAFIAFAIFLTFGIILFCGLITLPSMILGA